MSYENETMSSHVENLQKEYKQISKDLIDLQKELKHVNRALNKTQDGTFIDNILFKRQSTTKILTIPKSDNRQNLNVADKVTLYEHITGIHINNISMKYHPLYENDKLIDTSWLKYDIDMDIEKIELHLSYITNQKMEDVLNEKVKFNEIKELNVKLKKKIPYFELRECVDYFYKNPNLIGMLFFCIRDYSQLYTQRRNIGKILKEEYPEFVTTQLILDEEDEAYMNIIIKSNKKNREYFEIKWTITWKIQIYTVIDSYKIKLSYKEKNFMKSIAHNLENLVNFKTDLQNAESERMKLKFLQNAMLAVKAAELDS